jgi:hypothetical protein
MLVRTCMYLVDELNSSDTIYSLGVYTHQGFEQSRRDDLESLVYVLIYLSRGKLPWMGIKASDKQKKYEFIAMKKLNVTAAELFHHLPKQYMIIYNYVRSLQFYERPDYAYMCARIRSLFIKYRYQYDYIYDWYYMAKRMKNILKDNQ